MRTSLEKRAREAECFERVNCLKVLGKVSVLVQITVDKVWVWRKMLGSNR